MYHEQGLINDYIDYPFNVNIICIFDTVHYRLNESLEIIWVLEGDLLLDFYEEKYDLTEDNIFLINDSILHNYKTEDGCICLVIKIDKNYYSKYYPILNNVHFTLHDLELESKVQYNIRYILGKIVYASINIKKVNNKFLYTNVMELLSYIIENCSEFGEYKEKPSSDLERIRRVLLYITENYSDKILLSDLAEMEGLSPEYLSRFIKEKLGVSFQEYLNLYRLEIFTSNLLSGDKDIGNLSKEAGFSNSNYMNKVFKRKHGCTPGEYREINRYENEYNLKKNKEHNEYIFNKVRKYIELEDPNSIDKELPLEEIIDIKFSEETHYSNSSIKKSWNEVLNIGKSNLILNKDIQNQLKIIQREIGFKFARINMDFTDTSSLRLNWENYNRDDMFDVIDFLLTIGLKPFIELSYEDKIPGSNPLPFTGVDLEFLDMFMRTIINRYGILEVKQWRFECWKKGYWKNYTNKDSMLSLYNEYSLIWNVVKSINNEIPVGISMSYNNGYLNIEDFISFLEYISFRGHRLDFLTIKVLDKKLVKNDNGYINLNPNKYRLNLYLGLYSNYEQLLELLETKMSAETSIYITDFSLYRYDRNMIYDTSIIGIFILDSIVKNILVNKHGMSFLVASDLLQVEMDSADPFIGGRGLMTKNGIKKFSYNVYYILAKLGEDLVDMGRNYIVTRTRDSVQILIYNYRDLDQVCLEALEGDNPSKLDICYDMVDSDYVRFRMKGIAGKYEVTEYSLSREEGSAYYNWLQMGSPKALKSEEIRYLSGRSMPRMEVKELKIKEGDYFMESYLIPPYSLKFINMDKIF